MSASVQKEIDSMLDSLCKAPIPPPEKDEENLEDKDKEELEEEETPKEEDEEDKDKEEDKEKDTEDKDKDKDKEEDKEEDKDKDKEEDEDEEGDKDKLIAALRTQLNERAKREIKEPEKKEDKEEPLKLDEQDFLGDVDLEDVINDKAAFNKILNTVYSKGVDDARRMASERVLTTIPDIVRHNFEVVKTLSEASEKFYSDNKDLIPFKKVVAEVFEEVYAANPDKPYNELVKSVAPEARKRLGLKAEALKDTGKSTSGAPRLPGKKSGTRPSGQRPDLSPMQKEIDL